MNNSEKFNTLLNSCANARKIYNLLMSLVKPSFQETDDMSQKRQVIISELLSVLNKAESNQ